MNRLIIPLVIAVIVTSTLVTASDQSVCQQFFMESVLKLIGGSTCKGDRVDKLEKTVASLLENVKKIESKCCVTTFSSCEAIKAAKPDSPSGDYDLMVNGKKVNVYCNMDPLCDDKKGGWMRVADLNMKDAKQQCPSNFKLYQENGVRTCIASKGSSCQSVKFPALAGGLSYSKVCGRVIGYQKGSTDAFYHYSHGAKSIDSYYMDGVSITRGTPRQHLWTYTVSNNEGRQDIHGCPCATNSKAKSPSFVGNDYYCESGASSGPNTKTFYSKDALWDGKMCNSHEASCCKAPNMPWFKRDLGKPTKDQIELRICCSYGFQEEAVAISLYEIYVK